MKTSKSALALVMAALWGGAMLAAGVAYHFHPPYGEKFLEVMSSLYPGYHVSLAWRSVATGTLYGLVDGAIAGFLIAWLYALVLGRSHRSIPHGV